MAPTEKQLANLKPIDSSERARELQLKSAKARSERRQALEELKVSAAALEEVGSLTILRGLLQNALDNMDHDTAIRIAGQLAEYEAPKLQRQEVNQVTNVRELSDEELAEELKKFQ